MSIAGKTLQYARIVHGVFVLSAILYLWIATMIMHASGAQIPVVLILAFAVVSASSLGAAFFFRMRLIRPAVERLRENPEDAGAARQWRGGVLFSLVFCETVVLFGLALRMMGAGWNVCGAFYAAGIFFMLAWTPKLELLPQ